MIYRYDLPRCLNGWWDILPVYEESNPGEWETGKYLVPSCWNLSGSAIRLPGEKYFKRRRSMDDICNPEGENLFDTFGYPREWSRAKRILIRRRLDVCKRPGKRYFLILEASGPKTIVFINGQKAAEHHEYTLPLEVDVTEYLQDGENTAALALSDYDRNESGRTLWPSGNGFTNDLWGVWQDIYFVEKNEIYIDDITIRTSVRKRELTVLYRVKNTTGEDAQITVDTAITAYQTGEAGISVPPVCGVAKKGEIVTLSMTVTWENPKLWDQFSPNLYWLDAALRHGGEILDTAKERFGFREVWTKGDQLILNGHPIHLFYDWGHKETVYNYTKEWVLAWFSMLRDQNYNGSRLHTHPHPRMILELADEQGIFITGETAIHGSGGAQAADSDVFWENAKKHVAAFVRRDKNHPSVILWSCENEMRWNVEGLDKIKAELPVIRELFQTLDPTRIAYHEGDSSFWNEKQQALVSRHYGKECTGFGWWDHARPLHSGEMSVHHYVAPNNVLHLIGDSGYADYESVNRAATLDFLYIAEDARANGVCCLGPWNLSCLVNLRRHAAQTLSYEDNTAPGIKPLYVPEGSAEFMFWTDDAQKYILQPGSENFKNGFRPFALIDLSRKTGYYPDGFCKRGLTLVNDTGADVSGVLMVEMLQEDAVIKKEELAFTIRRGEIKKLEADLSFDYSPGVYTYRATAAVEDKILDTWTREILLREKPVVKEKGTVVAVYSDDSIRGLLEETGVSYRFTEQIDDISEDILLIGRNMVESGSRLNKKLQALLERGKRVILMGQQISVFPGIDLVDLSVQKTNIRGYDSPILSGVDGSELAFWGEDPYSLVSGDIYVANKMYRKDDGAYMNCLLDAGEGDFGKGDLESTPLFFAYEGEGLVIACQLNLLEKYKAVPAAARIFANMIDFAVGYRYGPKPCLTVGDSDGADIIRQALKRAQEGAFVIVSDITPGCAALIRQETGIAVAADEAQDEIYQCVRAQDDPVLSGVSNADLCGIETVSYAQRGSENFPVARHTISAPGLLPLLITAPKSAMYELYLHGGASELLRSYTLTHYCYDQTRQPDIVVGMLPYGEGRLILSAFSPPAAKRKRFDRVLRQIERNLCQGQTGDSALDGEIAQNGGYSEGFPTYHFVYNGPLSEELLKNMQESSVYQTERMNATPILTLCPFQKVTVDDGALPARQYDLRQPVVLYYTLESLIPRKNMGSNLGVPDPLAQTFLDIHGEGEFSLYLNGKPCGTAVAEEGICTFPDLEIERGYNHVLIVWRPTNAKSACKTRWRNILRTPEMGFLFTHTKSDT